MLTLAIDCGPPKLQKKMITQVMRRNMVFLPTIFPMLSILSLSERLKIKRLKKTME